MNIRSKISSGRLSGFILSILLILSNFGFAQIYSGTTFVGDVTTGSWTAVEGISAAVTNGGYYTNGVTSTNYYRLSGTNAGGRIPLSTNCVVTIVTSPTTNAVRLTWTRKGGIYRHVVEKSFDAGATWTNHLTVAPGTNSWLDTGSNTWTIGIYTNLYPALGTSTYPWTTAGDLTLATTTLWTAFTDYAGAGIAWLSANTANVFMANGSVPASGTWNMGAQTMTNLGLLKVLDITADTADGADDQRLDLSGGGGFGQDRGPSLSLCGNECPNGLGDPGGIYIHLADSGDPSNSRFSVMYYDMITYQWTPIFAVQSNGWIKLGTVTNGLWQGTRVDDAYLDSDTTNSAAQGAAAFAWGNHATGGYLKTNGTVVMGATLPMATNNIGDAGEIASAGVSPAGYEYYISRSAPSHPYGSALFGFYGMSTEKLCGFSTLETPDGYNRTPAWLGHNGSSYYYATIRTNSPFVVTNFNVAFSTATNVTFNFAAPATSVNCLRGRVWVSDTNIFSRTMTLSWYEASDYKGSNCYSRSRHSLAASPLSASFNSGSVTCVLADATGFTTNDLVRFSFLAQTNELARVSDVVGNTLYFEDALTGDHAASEGLSKVGEYSGFRFFNQTASTIYGRLQTTNAITTTVTISNKVKE